MFNLKSIFNIIALVLLALIIAFLSINYSAESEAYKQLAHKDSEYSIFELSNIWGLYGEPLYHILTKVLSNFLAAKYLLFYIVLFSVLLKFYFIFTTEKSLYPVWVYVAFFLCWFDGTLIRTSLASTIVYFALKMLRQNKIVITTTSIFLSIFFHFSSSAYLTFIPIYFCRTCRKLVRILFFISPLLSFFSKTITSFVFVIFSNFFHKYFDYAQMPNNSSGLYCYYLIILYILVSYLWLRFQSGKRRYIVNENCLFYEFCFSISMLSITLSFALIYNVIISSRLSDFLFLPIVFVYYVVYKVASSLEKCILSSTIIIIFLVRFLHAFYWNTRENSLESQLIQYPLFY